MLVLFVKLQLKPEYRERFMASALEDARGANEDEPGCLRFDVIVDQKEGNCIYFYEVYVDEAAFQEHLKAPHFIQWRDTVGPDWYVAPAQVVRGKSVYPPDRAWK